MLFKSIALAAVFLASASSAFDIHERHADIEARNGGYGGAGGRGGVSSNSGKGSYQFAPGIQTATGDTCGAAFGDGYQTCREASGDKNRLCYNPNAGQKCCSASWSCPNGSFCLSDGVCCPDGMDPASCGAQAQASSSAAAKSSSTVASSSTVTWSKVKPSATTGVSVKVVPTSFVSVSGATGGKSTPVTEAAPEATGPAQVSTNGASRDSFCAVAVGGVVFAALAAL